MFQRLITNNNCIVHLVRSVIITYCFCLQNGTLVTAMKGFEQLYQPIDVTLGDQRSVLWSAPLGPGPCQRGPSACPGPKPPLFHLRRGGGAHLPPAMRGTG